MKKEKRIEIKDNNNAPHPIRETTRKGLKPHHQKSGEM
jgi:hypothetical protein